MSADEVLQAMIDHEISVLGPVRVGNVPLDASWVARTDLRGYRLGFGLTPTLAVEALCRVLDEL